MSTLEQLSAPFATNPDLIQGSGGNTSVKISETEMQIKASGFRLSDIDNSNGFVTVNYDNIAEYFTASKYTETDDPEKHLKAFVADNIIGDRLKLPSMETGFHAVLDKYVVHTHSVYSNIINCTAGSEFLLQSIFPKDTPAFIHYCNPGFYLSKSIANLMASGTNRPKVIFLENHGLITHSNDAQEAVDLNSKVNKAIQNYYSIAIEYPESNLELQVEGLYKSNTLLLKDWMRSCGSIQAAMSLTLFPDQAVFFNGQIDFTGSNNTNFKISIHPETFEINYRTNEKEAKAIDETITAFYFILYHLKQLKLTPKYVSQANVAYITGMDMEKYRKNLMK
ncbi:MAG: class II aldolase [Bacteroidia bacterium]|nr:class II aldolase [Bacteroidia bacterium]